MSSLCTSRFFAFSIDKINGETVQGAIKHDTYIRFIIKCKHIPEQSNKFYAICCAQNGLCFFIVPDGKEKNKKGIAKSVTWMAYYLPGCLYVQTMCADEIKTLEALKEENIILRGLLKCFVQSKELVNALENKLHQYLAK